MKKIVFLLSMMSALFVSGCSKSADKTTDNQPGSSKAIAKGKVTDSNGSPISGAKVVMEHTVFYATYLYTETDANGNYSVQLTTGSWKVSIQIEKTYLGKIYKFDLHPDNENPLSGTEGGIRNFSWKLSGVRPEGGFYGSQVAVYPEPGSEFMMEDVQLTLTPNGPLVDGSSGQAITKNLVDIGGGEDGINDIPIGQYTITAKNSATGSPLQIRIRNTGNYSDKLTAMFGQGFTGSVNYQIVVQVRD